MTNKPTEMTYCADLRPGDHVPDIGTLDAVGEPGRDGEMRVRTTTGQTVGLMARGIVHGVRRRGPRAGPRGAGSGVPVMAAGCR